jgi:hypothetical protein
MNLFSLALFLLMLPFRICETYLRIFVFCVTGKTRIDAKFLCQIRHKWEYVRLHTALQRTCKRCEKKQIHWPYLFGNEWEDL